MRNFGIEIEIANVNGRTLASALNAAGIPTEFAGYTHRITEGWKVVTDSSVPNGCEVVSPILTSESDLETVAKVCRIIRRNHGRVNRTCGIHVHIDMNNATAQHIANVYNRYRRFEAGFDAIQPESRRANNNTYCKSLRSETELVAASTPYDTARARLSRYYKVNLQAFVKYGTIEFRQHAGSMNATKVCNWVKLLQAFVEASTPQTTAATCTESGKPLAIVNLLEEAGNGGLPPATIAALIGSTKGSVMAMVCNLRNRGQNIRTSRGRYYLETTAAVNPSRDEMYRGIPATLVEYYNRRAASLAS